MRKLVFCILCMIGVVASYGQSTTDGAIGGTVFDATGAVVAGAKIEIRNNGTAAQQTVNSGASGFYRVGGLHPGEYTVIISGTGLSSYKAEKVIVQVGSLTEISPRLGVAGTSETVDVTAEAPQINYDSEDFANTVNQTQIANLPINGGRWSNFTLLTPGVVSDSNAFGLVSVRGISTLLNNNTVDGADNNQAFFSEERGRTRIGYSTPKEAIDEFQVNTSNYSAEYGRSAGGVVNTVTKSGTNQIHGEGYYNNRDNTFGAFNEFTQVNVQTAPNVFTSQPFKPTDVRQIGGFGIGGPLVKDKLFFFLAYDWYHHNFPGVAVASNPSAFFAAPNAATLSTFAQRLNNLGNATPSAAQIAAAGTTYNTDLTALNTLLGTVPRTGDQNILLPKLDWTINSKNHAVFELNRQRWSSPAGIQTQAAVTRGDASFGNDFVKETWGVAKLDSAITSKLTNEVRFQYGRDLEFEFSQQAAPYEAANLLHPQGFNNPLGLPPSVNITNGFTFGTPTFLQRPSFPDEARTQIADTMTLSVGKHTFKYGIDFSHVNDNSQNLSTQFGSFSYTTLVDYFSDLNVHNSCTATFGAATAHVPCYSNFSQAFGPLGLEFTTKDYAVFAQDDWKILPRFTLNLGIRYEYEQLPSTVANLVNPAVPQTAHLPNNGFNIGPRAGFAWDVMGNGKTVLRGGFGEYFSRVINSTVFSALSQTGSPASQLFFSLSPNSALTGPCTPVFPQVLNAPPTCPGAKPSAVFFDRNFKTPEVLETDLILEHDLGWGTEISVSYLGSLGRRLPDFTDTNLCLSASQPGCTAATAPGTVSYKVTNGGPLAQSTYNTVLFRGRANPNFGSLTDVFSGINSQYHALVLQVNHRLSHNVQFNANYTWSHAYDFGQNQTTFSNGNSLLFPNSITAEKGNSIYDVPNRFVVNAVMDSPWKVNGIGGWFANNWRLSPIVQLQNGLPFGLGVSGNAPGGVVGGINGSGGSNRIDALGVNSFRLPFTLEPDLRLAKLIPLKERYRLELSADVFNIINKQNVQSVNTTGYSISTRAVTTPTGSVACSNAAPCLNFNVNPAANFASLFGTKTGTNNSNFLYTPRQIQIGAKFSF